MRGPSLWWKYVRSHRSPSPGGSDSGLTWGRAGWVSRDDRAGEHMTFTTAHPGGEPRQTWSPLQRRRLRYTGCWHVVRDPGRTRLATSSLTGVHGCGRNDRNAGGGMAAEVFRPMPRSRLVATPGLRRRPPGESMRLWQPLAPGRVGMRRIKPSVFHQKFVRRPCRTMPSKLGDHQPQVELEPCCSADPELAGETGVHHLQGKLAKGSGW